MSEPSKRRRAQTALAALAAGSLLVAGLAVATPATAAPPTKPKAEKGEKSLKHDFRSPMQKKQDALKKRAIKQVLAGKATPKGDNKVVKVSKGQYVQLANEGSDRIFVVLAEFGNNRHPSYCDSTTAGSCPFPSDGSPQKYDGPGHNEIPEPNRAVDNSTLWQADYNKAHYQDMYFNRMARYYESQSSGRYTVNGDVTEWVKVPFNEARYGRNFCGGIVCNNTWFLIRDAMAYWVAGQKAAGQTDAQIAAYLKTFDVQDRYDSNGNGEFNEPDGFIDHFQIVHSGGDEAAGDPTYGTDAIWSHRWYAALTGGGPTPQTGPNGYPGVNAGAGAPSGGQNIPNNPTGVWVGDYTIQPENGGLGVFAHEYAHDLGLPDLYDTSGNTGGAENSTGFWTLMSSGSNIGDGSPDGIGDAPTDMGTWEKFQLGWLNYEVARAGQKSEHKVGPSEYNTKQAQAVITVLPDKKVPLNLGAPCATCGTKYFYSGKGDDLNNTMQRPISTSGALTAKVRYETEEEFDYAFVESSSNGGTTWTPLVTNLSSPAATDQSGINSSGAGIDGNSGGAWVDLTATVPAGSNALRVRYTTDGGVAEDGFQIDNITVGGTSVGTAEVDEGWTFAGFRITTGSEIEEFFNAYIAENRQYVGYDRSLRTAYNFGFLNTKPDWVETFPYQNGLLVNYWDESQTDNNVGDHPGAGLILPVDAHPISEHWSNGQLMRQRIQTYDSTFGLERTDAITLHLNGAPTTIASKPAVPVFDDTKTWWYAGDGHSSASHGRYQVGWTGVDVPKTGTTIRVKSVSGTGFMQVQVAPK